MGRNGTVGVEWRVTSVPDNPKTAIIHACRHEPVLHRSYQKMAAHCGTVILPVPAAGRSPGYHPSASPHRPTLAFVDPTLLVEHIGHCMTQRCHFVTAI
ncbi:MAG: hypothetical protein NTX27_09785 [Verrucomicrobia bacterium]|nr:hypothetical protein [Verrucomicrobiota bacterium]